MYYVFLLEQKFSCRGHQRDHLQEGPLHTLVDRA